MRFARPLVVVAALSLAGCVEILVEAGFQAAGELMMADAARKYRGPVGRLRVSVTCGGDACGAPGRLVLALARCGREAALVEIAAPDAALGAEGRVVSFPAVDPGAYCVRARLEAGEVGYRSAIVETPVEIAPASVVELAVAIDTPLRGDQLHLRDVPGPVRSRP